METIQWSGYEWILQERWGQVHPEKSWSWYDPTAVSIDSNNYLHLKTQYNPKYFPDLNITSDTGIGLVSCTEKFSYGTFEVEAKLPQGKNLWPAFWMWSWDSWPPEIDVFEGYTNNYSSYFLPQFSLKNGLTFWNVATNAWWLDSSKGKDISALDGWLGLKSPDSCFLKYKVVWLPNKIEYFYNNKSVRVVTDPKVLDQCNKTTMNVVINNATRKPYPASSDSDFIVKYFKYTPNSYL